MFVSVGSLVVAVSTGLSGISQFPYFILLPLPVLTAIALTTRIQQLQTHMAKHKKDEHSKRGMDALYVRRRKLLDYMERKDYDSYRRVVKTLGLIR